jgi:ArsR family transcriptional regulator
MTETDRLLAALAHKTRRSALLLLRQTGELCLCELMDRLCVGQSTMSRHMAALKEAGLIADRRDAQWVRYRLRSRLDPTTRRIVSAVLAADAANDAGRIADRAGRSAA